MALALVGSASRGPFDTTYWARKALTRRDTARISHQASDMEQRVKRAGSD